MEVKFGETSIPEDFSFEVTNVGYMISPASAAKIVDVLFAGVAECLSKIKNVSVPKSILFNSLGEFKAGAKIEYVKNEDNSDPVAGHWNLTWSTIPEDFDGSDKINSSADQSLFNFFASCAYKKYHMRFTDDPTCMTMMNTLLEMIINYVRDNTKPGDPATLTLDGVFKAFGECEDDGSVTVAIVPDGDIKVLIKDDSAIQSV